MARPRRRAPETIAFLGDIHAGSWWGLWPRSRLPGDGFLGPRYLLDCWDDLQRRWPKKLDLACSCSLERLVRLRVLVACEYSGTVRDAFIRAGYDAMSCDLLPTEKDGPHYQGDVRDVLADGWDMMIAHPTCTYMANSGVCWLHKDPTRWAKLDDGAAFFRLLWDAPIPRIALENPVMHKYAKERIGGLKQSQTIQPWMFGHMESKATCLWLRGLPPLVPTNNVKDEMMKLPDNQRQRLHYLPPGPDRWKERSRTYAGIAEAMASQWGAYCMANDQVQP